MHTPETTPKTARILSIGAWRDPDGGWQWNNWFHVGGCPVETCDLTPRKLLRWLREEGYLSQRSAGLCSIDDDQHNVVICQRSNGMPLLAIEYGPCV